LGGREEGKGEKTKGGREIVMKRARQRKGGRHKGRNGGREGGRKEGREGV